jgi:ABC-2 type transport system ATP-binding protein
MQLIELRNAKKHYIKSAFNLKIESSDFILVTGDNGTGKTTLIHMLVGFIRPDIGERYSKKIKIGYLPERICLPRFIKVYEYLTTIAKLKKSNLNFSLFHAFKIPLDQFIHTLSKGNLQKVGLITAFLGEPDFVILDEPFSGLDDEAKAILIDYILRKNEHGQSVMISTHEPSPFLKYANKHIEL